MDEWPFIQFIVGTVRMGLDTCIGRAYLSPCRFLVQIWVVGVNMHIGAS